MITVKKLIEFLSKCDKEKEVTFIGQEIKNITNDNEGNVILSDHKPLGNCAKCNNPVYKDSELPNEYIGYCPNCNESLYEIEIIR